MQSSIQSIVAQKSGKAFGSCVIVTARLATGLVAAAGGAERGGKDEKEAFGTEAGCWP